MANIQLKVIALGDFSSVNTQFKALQAQVDLLQKKIAGIGLSTSLSAQLKNIQKDFSDALVSSGNFTKQQVQLTSETEKFGKALQSGKLSLGQYFGIITGRSAEAQKSVQALAMEQVKLNNSIVQTDITKQGLYSVYTPTAINATSKAVEIAAAKQNIFNLAVREGSQSLINFGKNTQWAGRQLTVGLSMPVLLFGSQAMKTFQQVNDELVRMQKVYGTGLQAPTKAALDGIKKDVTSLAQELARTMGISAKDTAAMAADLAATGKTGVDLLTATREAMRLSKLGEMSTQEAMQTTISLQNVYKLNTKELSGAINFLNAVENQTSTSLQDLAAGIPKVGPIVQQLGGSFKDTAVMMVAMKEAGVPAAQSANAIKSAIASMINPTKQAKAAFQGFGIDLAGIATSTGGNPIKMIMQLQSALKGIAPLAQAQLIEKLFGKFQEARIQALITNLGAVNSQTRAAFDLANASAPQLAAIAAGEMKIATESTTGKFKRAIETLKADLIPIGEKIMQVATTIMNFGASIASFFNKLPGPIKSGLGILLTLGAIAGPVIMVTGLFANLMGQVLKVGYGLLGILDGSRKWKDLMTPAGIAAKTATEAFNTGLLENISAVDTLNAAMQRLIVSIEQINLGMSMGTGTGLLANVERAVTGGIKLPGMATGGIVPGTGNGDTFPAMLTPGESVIPKAATQKYGGLIQGMINGTLPGFSQGVYKVKKVNGQWVRTTDDDPLGESVQAEMLHSQPLQDESLIGRARAAIGLQTNARGKRSLDVVNDVEPSLLTPGPASVNQATNSRREGMLGSQIADEYEKALAAGIDPIAHITEVMKKLGIPLHEIETTHAPALRSAFQGLIEQLKTTKANMRFGTNPNMKINAGETAGGSFEAQMYGALEQPLSTIQATSATGRRWSLKDIYSRVLGTRGASASRRKDRPYNPEDKSNTGRPVVLQDDQSLATFEDSIIRSEFPQTRASLFSTSGTDSSLLARMGMKKTPSSRGSQVEIAMAEATGTELGAATDRGFRSAEGIDSHSNSKKGIKAAHDYTGGVKQGLEEGMASVESTASGVGDTVDKTVKGRFSRAFGVGSKMMSNPMGRIGASMGLTTATQMLSPMINKLPGGNLATDAMTGASMGMNFGPWGAAAGAAIALVGGGIKSLMAQEKLHRQESEADFAASSAAVEFFGSKIADTTHKMITFHLQNGAINDNLSKTKEGAKLAGAGLNYTNDQLDSFKKMATSLPKDNPLALVLQQIKDTTDQGKARDLAQQFATMQMSISGISQAQASQLTQMMLTMSGHYAGGAGVSAADQMAAIKQMLSSTQGDQKKFEDFVGKIQDLAVNSTSWDAYNKLVATIGSSAQSSDTYVQALINHLKGIGDMGGASLLASLTRNGYSLKEISDIQTAKAAGVGLNLDVLTPDKAKEIHQAAQYAIALNKQSADAVNKVKDNTAAAAAATQVNVKALEKQKKALEDNLHALQLLQKQTSQQTSFETTKEDLKNQIIMAQASGDNLKAQLLQQQLFKTSSDYNLQTKVDAAQELVNNKQAEIDKVNAAAVVTNTANTASNVAAGTAAVTTAIGTAASTIATAVTGKDKLPTLPKGATAGGDVTGFASQVPHYADIQATFGKGLENVNANVKKMQEGGSSIPTFKKFAGNSEWEDKNNLLTVGAQRYIIQYGNNGKGFEKGDQFTYGDQVYTVSEGKSSLYAPSAQLQASGSTFVGSGRQSYPKDHPRKISMSDLETAALKYMNHMGGFSDLTKKGADTYINSIKKQPSYLGQLMKYLTEPGLDGSYVTLPWNEKYLYNANSEYLKPQKKASGGHISGPGSATSDSIPAMLSNGEYVINAGAVAHYGKGTFDALNAKHLARGGVARTNSSITYHKQHMNRTSRHFAEGGIVSSLIGNLMGGVDKGIGNGIGWLSKTALEIGGVSPLMRILSGKKETNWDYLGAASLAALPLKGAGLIPKAVRPLMGLMEGMDISQGTVEAAQGLRSGSASGSNHIYNVNVHVDKIDSTVDMTKAIHDALNKVQAKAKMSGATSGVGR